MKVLILVGCFFLPLVSAMGQQSEVRSVGTFKGVKSAEAMMFIEKRR